LNSILPIQYHLLISSGRRFSMNNCFVINLCTISIGNSSYSCAIILFRLNNSSYSLKCLNLRDSTIQKKKPIFMRINIYLMYLLRIDFISVRRFSREKVIRFEREWRRRKYPIERRIINRNKVPTGEKIIFRFFFISKIPT
jgi:hypothetical protein